VRPVLARYAAQANLAHKRLNAQHASAAFTGSTLQMQLAQYRIFKANKLRITPAKYGSVLGATPKVSGYPKWFFAAMTDGKGSSAVRDIVVFVQDKQDAPWRAAYTPLTSERVRGALAPGVDVADVPDVAPLDDMSLAIAPGQVAPAMADVINQGGKSAHLRSFAVPDWAKSKRKSLLSDRRTFKTEGWTGSASFSAAKQPVYAVRTKSGGALVWSAIDRTDAFRHTSKGGGITWEYQSWGDLLRPFIGRSSAKQTLNSVDRVEMVSYVPPKGQGTIQILASRWAPISIKGA
jgi:hypothetical protein